MIGIIVPFYKNEQQIERCINSILNQSYSDYKLYLVDDGSPDKCGEICDDYSLKYENITVIHQNNQGLSAARNSGINRAIEDEKIEWLTFIDGDDWVHKDYLKVLFEACEKDNTEISIAYYLKTEKEQEIESVTNPEREVYTPEELVNLDSLSFPYYSAWGKLIRKEIIKNAFFPYGKLYEDAYTTYKWLYSVDRVSVVNMQLYYYYVNMSGIIHGQWSNKKLDVLPAFIEQCEYFRNKNLKKALSSAQSEFIYHVSHSLVQSEGDAEVRKEINKNIRAFFKENKTELSKENKDRIIRLWHPKYAYLRSLVLAFFSSLKEDGLKKAFERMKQHFTKRKNQ